MSYIITAIVSMIFGAVLALLVRNSGNISAEERAFNDGYEEGRKEGFRSACRRGKVFNRVDVAPGPDSIRPEGKYERV